MASYAPLFANINYKKWNPDLINFDNARSYGTPSYYVQKMFSENRGDVVLPVELSVSGDSAEPAKPRNGKMGLGTWATQSEYKDLRVVKDGKVLYESDFRKREKDWSVVHGAWKTANGVYRQTGLESDCRTVAGHTQWSDYTITVKARKLGGAEGFLVLFSVKDDDNFLWWNVGGWGNTQDAVELAEEGGKAILGKAIPGSVETGRWYDLKVELKGETIRCYLDGRLINDVTYDRTPLKPLHAVAGWKESTNEVVLKVVNVSNRAIETDVDLKGIQNVATSANVVVLTSGSPADENSIDQPDKVVPKESTIAVERPEFHHLFPPNSVTVLRMKKAQ
jgi:alpha-L-arabinofuranosidase